MFDDLKDDMLHILIHLFVYQYKSKNILSSPTRDDLMYEIIGLNAMAENIMIRTARMFDKPKQARSLFKLSNYKNDAQIKKEVDDFYDATGKKLIDLRHKKLAHMNKNEKSSYPIDQLPKYVYESIEFLFNLLDKIEGTQVSYTFKVSSTSSLIDLRKELFK